MFQSIVVAIDGSEPSARALNAACELSRAFGGEVHLVHALEGKATREAAGASGELASPTLTAAVAQAEENGVSPASATTCAGDPFEEIMTIVGLYGADLIVTGRRGLGGISGLFAGSTSQQISKHADCAFLSVK